MTPDAMDNTGAQNRVPFRLVQANDELQCTWLGTYNNRFIEPFFDDTMRHLRITYPQNRGNLGTGSLQLMQQEAQNINAAGPSVIIFHLSRCGSTLVSQLFASSGRFIVLSEVPFFDDVLGLPLLVPGFDESEIAALFASALNLYSRKRFAEEENAILKTDCWHIFYYHTLRKMFPDVPFVLMYRSPNEVLTSHLRIAGRQTVPELVDPRIFGLPGMPDVYQRDVYTASIIQKMLAKFLEVSETDTQTLLVNYKEGPVNIVKKIAGFAKLALSGDELAVMEVRSRYHSKKPGELFGEEPAAGVPACLDEAMRLYELLEQKRNLDDRH